MKFKKYDIVKIPCLGAVGVVLNRIKDETYRVEYKTDQNSSIKTISIHSRHLVTV